MASNDSGGIGIFQIHVAHQASAYIYRLDRSTQKCIANRLRQLAENPYGPYTKPLTGVDRQRSSRVGGWRIIYTVDEAQETVNVSLIASRGEVYRRL